MLVLKLIEEVNYIENRLDDVEIDRSIFEKINKEMKGLFSIVFGHTTWNLWENKGKRRQLRQERA